MLRLKKVKEEKGKKRKRKEEQVFFVISDCNFQPQFHLQFKFRWVNAFSFSFEGGYMFSLTYVCCCLFSVRLPGCISFTLKTDCLICIGMASCTAACQINHPLDAVYLTSTMIGLKGGILLLQTKITLLFWKCVKCDFEIARSHDGKRWMAMWRTRAILVGVFLNWAFQAWSLSRAWACFHSIVFSEWQVIVDPLIFQFCF